MKRLGRLVAVLVVAAGYAVTQTAVAAPADSTRKKLHQNTVIQGYPCAKGYAWFYADGKLDNCWVSQETQYGEALIPRGSLIYLKPDGTLWQANLAHSTRIHDVLCDGGGFLGPVEGSGTDFFPSGKLWQCYLAGDQVVQGVPCRHNESILGVAYSIYIKHQDIDIGIEFYQSGKLKSCLLSEDFGGQKKKTLWKSAAK